MLPIAKKTMKGKMEKKGKNIFGRDKAKKKDKDKKEDKGGTSNSTGGTSGDSRDKPSRISSIWALLTGEDNRDDRDGGDQLVIRDPVPRRKHHFALERWFRDHMMQKKEADNEP